MTNISRDRIQFEDIANEVNDGNEQSHRDRAANEWAIAATDYLQANGGGDASVRRDRDHTRFAVDGDKAIADAADDAGWDAARKYVAEEVATVNAD